MLFYRELWLDDPLDFAYPSSFHSLYSLFTYICILSRKLVLHQYGLYGIM